jgi:ubiquinone/menaquinone biosynthesis C-methylase UbiE
MSSNDIERLRTEYARRRQDTVSEKLYSVYNPSYLFAMQQRERSLLSMLREQGLTTLSGKRILEVGCGRGGVLREYLDYGADLNALTGIDLLPDRLVEGRGRLFGLRLACANGEYLPFSPHHFDLVLQYTAFSSILDPQVKAHMAAEMLRVLHPDGMIIWYDFWLNPKNAQTKGIRMPEIRQLFPRCTYNVRRITLAPPLARRIVPISWIMAALLEKLTILNTHYLVIIKPERA